MSNFLRKLAVVSFLCIVSTQSSLAFCIDSDKKMFEEFAEQCRQAQIEYESCDLDIYYEPIIHRFDPSLVTFYCFSHKVSRCGFAFGIHMKQYIPLTCVDPINTKTPSGIEAVNLNPVTSCGSIIEPSNQVLGETISLNGANFDLVYFTSRSSGKKSDYEIKFNIPNNTNTNEISLSLIENAAPFFSSLHSGGTEFTHVWNGLDQTGKETWGGRKLFLTHKVLNNNEFVSKTDHQIAAGNFKAKKLGLGGWVPSIWHFYDVAIKRIYFGNGSSRNVEAIIDGANRRVSNEDGSEVYYFDELGRIVETRHGLTGAVKFKFYYDSNSEVLKKITDAHNNKSLFIYEDNKLIKIISANGTEFKTQVDQSGNLISLTRPKNETFKMTYEQGSHLLKSFKKPSGLLSTFSYDEFGNLLQDTNNSGLGSLLAKASNGLTLTTAAGRIRKYNYNNDSKSETVVNPSGLTINYVNSPTETSVNHPSYSLKKQINDDGRFPGQSKFNSSVSINNFGNRNISESRTFNLLDDANPFSLQNYTREITEGDSRIIHTYDGLAKTHRFDSIEGRHSTIQTDSLERPLVQQVGNLMPVKYLYAQDKLVNISQGDRSTKMSYDSRDLLKSITNGLGYSQYFSYDQASRLSAIKLEDGRVVNLKYDSNDNLINISPPGRPSHIINFGLNELESSYVPPKVSGLLNTSTTYTYNNDKDLIKISRPDGEVINYNWNGATGLLDSITGSFGTISRSYQNELPVMITDQHGQKVNFTYTGTVVSGMSVQDPQQNEIYNFNRAPSAKFPGLIGDESLRVGSETKSVLYDYDNDKLLIKAGDLNLEYNKPNGQLVKSNLDNIKETYTYNNVGEIKSYSATTTKDNKEVVIYSYQLSRDKLGRIISKDEVFLNESENEVEGRRFHSQGKKNDNKAESRYVYDKAGRLVRVHGDRRNSNYIYDLNSNRIAGQTSQSPFIAAYDQQDRLIRFNTTTFNYNPNGETISKTNLIKIDLKKRRPIYETTAIQYDVFGNLLKHGKVFYKIDPLNRRLSRTVDGVLTNMYAYNPEGQMIAELDQNGTLLKYFIYGSRKHVPDYFVDTNNERFKIITDHLGSVRYVVNSSTGEVKLKMNHDEFGKVLVDTNPNYLPFGFAGGIYDFKTGLVRFGARDYDPQTGRWLSKDPIGFSGGDTNLYGYTINDPINFIDPEGFSRNKPGDKREVGSIGGAGGTFYVSPNGQTAFAPTGSTITPTKNGNGLRIDTGNGTQIRLMGPNQMSPNGYGVINRNGKFYNGNGDIVPKTSPDAHIQPSCTWEK